MRGEDVDMWADIRAELGCSVAGGDEVERGALLCLGGPLGPLENGTSSGGSAILGGGCDMRPGVASTGPPKRDGLSLLEDRCEGGGGSNDEGGGDLCPV